MNTCVSLNLQITKTNNQMGDKELASRPVKSKSELEIGELAWVSDGNDWHCVTLDRIATSDGAPYYEDRDGFAWSFARPYNNGLKPESDEE